MKAIVIGCGMAGSRVASDLHARDRDVKVTVFGAERHPPYNRIMLSTLLAGRAAEEDLAMTGPPAGMDVRLGVRVTAIDPDRRLVITPDEVVEYDALVLATGARAVYPALPGLDAPTVRAFRTLDDCRAIVAGAATARAAIVLGGGLLGLETARGLAGRGLAVTVVHAGPHLMDRQLDAGGAEVLARTLDGLGVAVRLGARALRWTGAGLDLADGTTIPADLLVLACGARPDTDLAAAAGIAVRRGVLVDHALRTSDPHVWAIGDCAEHDGTVYGLVAPAWEQADTVADRLTGATTCYRGTRPVIRLKATGLDVAAMGSVADHPDAEVVSFADPARGTYARLVIRDDRLAGAVLLGDNPSVGTVVQLFDRDAEVPEDRRSLLLGRSFGAVQPARSESPAFLPAQALVCRCNSVTKAAITDRWRDGARTVPEIVTTTRATTGCGGCRDAVTGIVDWLAAAESEEGSP
ncbi:FAD-dependent oxidoreductase [Plantactinospora sp. GCM10030261]|uniref:FAD-dependent oxidoreductase n=1 Tax=Plantactinospora sp. GCM10030261 TaxID=3273420 RepID=UPI00360CBA69